MNFIIKNNKQIIAYLAHGFPVYSEHYFQDEVDVLRAKNFKIIIFSCLKSNFTQLDQRLINYVNETIYFSDYKVVNLVKASILFAKSIKRLKSIYLRLIFKGNEGLRKRLKGILHTFLGIYFGVLLKDKKVTHIHVHHGYLASWVAMIASIITGITYSITLHGSDLLIDRVYLDLKLNYCSFCLTISHYNRRFILRKYPSIDAFKIIVNYLGVEPYVMTKIKKKSETQENKIFSILTIGRLETVKNQKFLIRACANLKKIGFKFKCLIIGDGKLKKELQSFIEILNLEREVFLLGYIDSKVIEKYYRNADLFVLTSNSEGLPIVLMEAMVNGTIVLAPNITGIPEIVDNNRTGFLYEKGNINDFILKIKFIHRNHESLDQIRNRAKSIVLNKFNKQNNMNKFAMILHNRLKQLK
jgi:colanic acid/amylovoran biosynthesis glycosyltransferase